jgi:dihydrofolate reductase
MTVKVIVYMHISVNGMIARLDNSGFSSKKAKAGFLSMINKVQVNIVGRKTFEVASRKGGFPLKGLNIVMTTHSIKNTWGNDVIITDKKPIEVLKIVEERGYRKAMVGGGVTAASFIKEGLVDELFLDIEPVIIGRGIPVFSSKKFERRLKLIGLKRISKDEVRLHYKVL